MNAKKLALAAAIVIVICLYVFGGGQKYLNIDFYQNLFLQAPWLTAGVYFLLFVLGTSFSLPVTAILMVGSGIVFGLTIGLPLALCAMTLGGTVSFLSGRFLFRDVVERRFTGYIDVVNRGMAKEGAFYLFGLRMIPIVPFWVANLLMGITSIKIPVFMFATFCGMVPITLVFVYAGSQLGSIKELNVSAILSPGLILALCLLAGFPFVAKFLLALIRRVLKKEVPDSEQ
jgi:uncharacterized membrane protein YdjX (TVP38/TMEM64 family)